MIDMPGFLLNALSDICPKDAGVIRLNKYRFKIQPRSPLMLSTPSWLSLELELNETLVTSVQWAIASGDKVTLTLYAENIRKQVAEQLSGGDTEPEVSIQLL